MKTFRELGLSEETLKAVHQKGFEEPTPIQEKTIPLLLSGNLDIIGQAQTGTGKTAAFGLPLIERLNENNRTVQALILTPTRELAIQVSEEINSLKGNKALNVIPIYGGQSIELQLKSLKKGVHIVVGTPGRIIDHLDRGSLKIENINFLVLDEADEMIDMGFIEDIETILENTPDEKQMLFFSATMPDAILKIAKTFMKKYEIISEKKADQTTPLTEQIYFEVYEKDKFEALCRIIDVEKEFYGIVFCRTKNDVDVISHKLVDRGYDADLLHGDITQSQREKTLKKFKDQKVNILVATDVAARGIDVNDLTHVINYSLPQDPESYVHRIGRTGRAGKEGTAITFITPAEYSKLAFIKRITKTEIRKEKVPGVAEIINIKKERIKEDIFEIIDSEGFDDYMDIAQELLLYNNDPISSIASLLKYAFQNELSDKNYNTINEIRDNRENNYVDKTGKSRLFISLGKMDKMTPKKLIEYIQKEVNIDQRKIMGIQIFDKFSFFNVPFHEAELILNAVKKKTKGRPVFEMAKKRKN